MERNSYIEMVETHTSAQMCMSHVEFSRLKDDWVEKTISELSDAKSTQKLIQINIPHILCKMLFMDKLLWLCLVKTDTLCFQVIYEGACPLTSKNIHEFLKCPAAQVMYLLLKQGFMKVEIEAFI